MDSKETREELLKRVNDKINAHENPSASEEQLPEINQAIAEKEYGQTIEGKYLDPYAYPAAGAVMRSAALAAKPASMMATPVLESLRYAIRKGAGMPTNEIDTWSDVKSIANQKASTGPLLEDVYSALGIEQQPIAKTVENLTGYEVNPYLRKQFPKATAFLESVRPTDIASIPADLALYGKFAGPVGQKMTSSAFNSIVSQKDLAKNILKSGSTDRAYFNELARSGKLDDVAQRIIDDPTLNRVDRTKVLEELTGEASPQLNQYGILRSGRRGGKISEITQGQFDTVESIPNDQYSFDTMEANLRAKALLKKQGLYSSVEDAASSKIDEALPYAGTEQHQVDKIKRKESLLKQIAEVDEAVVKQKIDEISKLSKQNIEGLSKKGQIPSFIDNPNYVPERTEYVTSKEFGPSPEYTPIKPIEATGSPNSAIGFEPSGPVISPERPLIEKTSRVFRPSQGNEQVWNKTGAQKKLQITKELENIQNQMEMLQGQNPDHPAVKSLIAKRDALSSEYWDIADQGFPTMEAYNEHLTGLNQKVFQEANDARIRANKYMGSLEKGSAEYNAAEAAARAVEQSASEVLNVGLNQLPQDKVYAYHKAQSELSDLLALKDLYKDSYGARGGANIPMGGFSPTGLAREAIALKGRYVDPVLLGGAKKFGLGANPIDVSESMNKMFNSNYLNDASRAGAQTIPLRAGLNDYMEEREFNEAPIYDQLSKEQGRSPQSIPTEIEAKAMQRGLVENIADYEIPRSSKEILANPLLALAKLSQVTNDPQVVKGLQDAIEKHPDKLKTILPLMGLQFPNLFVADKYNRFDGKIFDPDPAMKAQIIQRAYKDVELKRDLSNTEKVMFQDGLNRDGSLPESFQ